MENYEMEMGQPEEVVYEEDVRNKEVPAELQVLLDSEDCT